MLKPFANLVAIAASLAGVAAAQTIAEGETLYASAPCRACHSVALAARPDQTDLRARVTYPFATFESIVRFGRSGTDMPAFGDRYSSVELCGVFLYIRSMQAHTSKISAADCGLAPAAPDPPKKTPPPVASRPPPASEEIEALLAATRPLFGPPEGTVIRLRCRGGGQNTLGIGNGGADAASSRRWGFTIQTTGVGGSGGLLPGQCRSDVPMSVTRYDRSGLRLVLKWSIAADRAFEHVRFQSARRIASIDAGLSEIGFDNPYAPLLNAAMAQREYYVELTPAGPAMRDHRSYRMLAFAVPPV